jgi:hypothetical protein
MCKWCNKLNTLKSRLQEYNAGYMIGESINFKPWDDCEDVRIELWYDKEYGMKNKEFLLELGHREKDSTSGIRLVAPVKYCPNCGKKLEV